MSAVVLCDASTRFTLFSTLCFRVERGGVWEDRPSFAFTRRLPETPPPFEVSNSSAGCNISVHGNGSRLELSWAGGALEARRYVADEPVVRWRMGDAQQGSLGGTVFSLSGVTNASSHQFPLAPLNCSGSQRTDDPLCTAGVLSTSGWAAYDDTNNQVRTASGDWAASAHAGRPGDADLTVFLYGRDYRGALSALASLSGSALLPPRRWFGVWWSRWQKYSAGDFQHIAAQYEARAAPRPAPRPALRPEPPTPPCALARRRLCPSTVSTSTRSGT